MKQCIIIFTVLIASVNTLLAKVKNPVTETRKVEAFQTLKLSTVGTVYLTQGDNYSLRFEGEEEYVKQNRSNVTDGVLSIDCNKDRNGKSLVKNKNGVIIYITAPDLKEITFNGVGSLQCNHTMKLGDVKITISGVGDLDIEELICQSLDVKIEGIGKGEVNVKCQKLKATVSGIGGLTLSGETTQASISKTGLGYLDTEELKIDN